MPRRFRRKLGRTRKVIRRFKPGRKKRTFGGKALVKSWTRPRRERYGTTHVSRCPVPLRMKVRLPYYDTVELTSGGLTFTEHNINLNSIWDPDGTGIGHTARGTTFYNQLFNSYRVVGVKIDLQFYISDTQAVSNVSNNCLVGYYVGPQFIQNNYSNIYDIMEDGKDKYKDVHMLTRNFSVGTTNAVTPMTRYAGKKGVQGAGHFTRFFTIPSIIKDFDVSNVNSTSAPFVYPKDYTSAMGGFPNALIKLVLFASSLPDASGSPDIIPDIFCSFRIEYYTMLEGIKPVPLSSNDLLAHTGAAEGATGSTGNYWIPVLGGNPGHTGVAFNS